MIRGIEVLGHSFAGETSDDGDSVTVRLILDTSVSLVRYAAAMAVLQAPLAPEERFDVDGRSLAFCGADFVTAPDGDRPAVATLRFRVPAAKVIA